MKKIFIIATALVCYSYTIAQTEFDALKLEQTDIIGTARYMGMAGAFGALGGDASSIKDNPAGLGIYRSSEIVGTLNFNGQINTSTWNDKTSRDNSFKGGFNNFAYIVSIPTWENEHGGTTGLLNSNWSFSFNTIKSFNRNLAILGGSSSASMTDYMAYLTTNAELQTKQTFSGSNINYDNPDVPYLSVMGYEAYLINEENVGWRSDLLGTEKVTPSYYSKETGSIDEYSLGWAGNFSNVFYLGATANIQTINYNSNTSYSEVFNNRFGKFTLNNNLSTTGAGINLKIGAIIKPTDFLRFGVSINTPTVYALTNSYNSSIQSNLYSNFLDSIVSGNSDNYGSYDFQLQSPVQLTLSSAFIMGQKGLISVEYNYNDYSTSKYMDINGNSKNYQYENDGMSKMLMASQTWKIGAEYRLNNNFSLRAGYAYSTSATTTQAEKNVYVYNTTRVDTEYFKHNNTNYFSAGFGFREAGWYIDFACMSKLINESFMPFNSNYLAIKGNQASVITNTNNAVVTLGFRF